MALARSSVAGWSESSDEVVGVGRLPEAIARRSDRRGSWSAASDAIVVDRAVALGCSRYR